MATIRQLHAAIPDATIDIILDPHICPVVEGHPAVSEVIAYRGRQSEHQGWFAQLRFFWRWIKMLRSRQYDVVFDFLCTPETALWTRFTGANIRAGSARRAWLGGYTYVVDTADSPTFSGEQMLLWLGALGIRPEPWTPTAVVRPLSAPARSPEDKSRIVLNPSATWEAKSWPSSHFGKLAKLLARDGREILVAWGPGEEQRRDDIVRASENSASALPPTTIHGLADALSAAQLVITTDSGPKHIAVAEGTPTLTLFGSTNPVDWHAPMRGHAWLTNSVDCHPCDLLICPVEGHPCLTGLSPETVALKAEEMLSHNPQSRPK